jgi:transposase-like protein
MSSRPRRSLPPCAAFAGFRFPAEVIMLAVRWYLRYGLSYPDVEELLAERGVEVDHVTVYPSAWHHVERYANNRIEADDSQLKHRLRPMRGLRTDRSASVVIAGHAFMQNLRRSHYEIRLEAPPALRVAAAFAELSRAI